MNKTQIVYAGNYLCQAAIPLEVYQHMHSKKKLRQLGWTMCQDCIRGKHDCLSEACLCVCNEADFPWPPRA